MSTTTLTLKAMPEEVRTFLLQEQCNIKKKKPGMFSLESTIYAIIKDYKRCKEGEIKLSKT